MALTDRQREERRSSIGASEVAALAGLDPYKSELDLWMEKTGQAQEVEPSPEMAERLLIGELMEGPVAEVLSRRHQRKVVKPTSTYKHACGVLQANVDRQFDKAARGSTVIEIKNTGYTEAWGDPELGTDALPIKVLMQVQAQLLCADAEKAVVAVMQARNGQRLVEYSVYRVEKLCSLIAEKVPAWWDKHVVKGERPALDRQPYETLSRLTPVEGRVIDLDPELLITHAKRKAAFDVAEAELEAAKLAIAQHLGDAEMGECSFGGVHFKSQQREQFQKAKFAAAHPDLAAKFTETITTDRFIRVYPKKGSK